MVLHTHLDSGCARARHPCAGHAQTLPRPQLSKTYARRSCTVQAAADKVVESSVSAGKRVLLGVSAGVAAAALLLASPQPSSAAEPLLAEIQQQREQLEYQARTTQDGKLCATPFGIDVVGVTVAVALVGAAVGGTTARQRKQEAERLNEQLRKINASLRQQARAGWVPREDTLRLNEQLKIEMGAGPAGGPFSSSSSNGNGMPQQQSVTATITLPKPAISSASPSAAAAAAAAAATTRTLMSLDEEEMTLEQLECRDTLRAGKRLLKQSKGAAAQVNFEAALLLSRRLADKVQERRATRGLAAACKLQREFPAAIAHYQRVLQTSQEMGEFTGDADAYGSIADCYTEMDRFDKAAEFYDKYIQHMED